MSGRDRCSATWTLKREFARITRYGRPEPRVAFDQTYKESAGTAAIQSFRPPDGQLAHRASASRNSLKAFSRSRTTPPKRSRTSVTTISGARPACRSAAFPMRCCAAGRRARHRLRLRPPAIRPRIRTVATRLRGQPALPNRFRHGDCLP